MPLTLALLPAVLAPPQAANIGLNAKEYFEGPGFAFPVYHNNYSGYQGGLVGRRLAHSLWRHRHPVVSGARTALIAGTHLGESRKQPGAA